MRRALSLLWLVSIVACGRVTRPGGDEDTPAVDAAGDVIDGGDEVSDASAPDAAETLPTSCAEIRESDPGASDGPYTIDSGGNPIEVWCVMSGATNTYEALGFGSAFAAYDGYGGVTASLLGNARIQQAFIWLYNQQNGALNLDPGWNSGNCCFKVAGSPPSAMLTLGGWLLYPAEQEGGENCNLGYASDRYRFLFALGAERVAAPDPLPTDFFASYAPSETTNCGDDNNPTWFFRRY